MLENRAANARHTVTTTVFDPQRASEADWANFLAYWRLRTEEDFPGDPVAPDADTRHNVQQSNPLYEFHRVLAVGAGGKFIGSLSASFRREGTSGHEAFAPFLEAWGGVLRPHRRQGVASALLRALLELMEARGKSVATIKTHLPEGHAFMQAVGAPHRHRSVENRMYFADLDWSELAGWRADGFGPGHGLRAEMHAGRVPLERLATLMAPLSALLNDAPTTLLERPPLRYDLEDFPPWYADMDRRGGDHFLVLLLDGDEVVAVCDAAWNRHFPDRMHQRLTAVDRRWRGKGLAKAVKAAMLQLVRERHPEVTMAYTHNAEVNAPMLSINHRLGYKAHRHDGYYQLGTENLRSYLSAREVRP
ncbi:Acetyltransferase (GNAT) family protein [Variovorax sp. NFACC28]|nr:Acetyltransferase (GNAT) family protein [Variovorax sp. NFACC28]SEG84701.1 Acetyltransferase (GNAT) family protein [Variovorax sp. NFACC29]SFD18234.1 Acetyltransferase (GNAT) family protein [Variovorax sp. NFACC26]SFG25527.1 Acetyltransferase (GNAT) family protein [Variovorax sp. NFACC27]